MFYLEKWKDIKGYEGLYQVSNLGRVKSLRKNKIMNCFDEGEGKYIKVNLYKDRKEKTIRVHRLVANAFLENRKELEYKVVNHKDSNKKNNNVENLEIVTQKENAQHAWQNTRKKDKKIVLKISLEKLEILEEFESASKASEKIKVSRSSIVHACSGKRYSCGSFRWIYKDEYENNGFCKLIKRNKKTGGKEAKKVLMLNPKTNELIEEFESTSKAAKELNTTGIKNAIRNGTKCKGFLWKFKEEE